MKSTARFAAAAALLTGAADAFWRMDCHSRVGLARIDPLVEPNEVANHGHVIHGGNNFGMDTTHEKLRESDCTSCLVKEDKSAYWTPSMNFIFKNGTTEVVPQVGGMLAYYLLYGEDIQAFPDGFQMLAGDTRLRNFSGPVPDPEKSLWGPADQTQHALGQKAIGFNCLDYKKQPEGSMYRHFLPDKSYMDANCPDGIRAELFFPSCWNGKDLDSDNHRDHVLYPNLVNGGDCPKGFDNRVPSLFYETIWNTAAYKGLDGQFVLSNGDTTGYGYHGDFIGGWDEKFLQEAVDTCRDPSGLLDKCPVFTRNNGMQTQADAAQCKMKIPKILAQDNCAGPAEGLCGNVPIQGGPAYASLLTPGNAGTPTAAITSLPTSAAPVPTLTYKSAASVATDKYGGGISVAAVAVNSQPSEIKVAATSKVADAPVAVAPAPTSAPVALPPNAKIIGTSVYTSAGTVYEVAIEEVVQYVTVDAPQRRHVHHMHHRRDREHGLLGRY